MAEENPFMKDYGYFTYDLIKDMSPVAKEVLNYIASKYGPNIRIKNMLYFLAVFTCGCLKGMGWKRILCAKPCYTYMQYI
jgi:hypothetical protein